MNLSLEILINAFNINGKTKRIYLGNNKIGFGICLVQFFLGDFFSSSSSFQFDLPIDEDESILLTRVYLQFLGVLFYAFHYNKFKLN